MRGFNTRRAASGRGRRRAYGRRSSRGEAANRHPDRGHGRWHGRCACACRWLVISGRRVRGRRRRHLGARRTPPVSARGFNLAGPKLTNQRLEASTETLQQIRALRSGAIPQIRFARRWRPGTRWRPVSRGAVRPARGLRPLPDAPTLAALRPPADLSAHQPFARWRRRRAHPTIVTFWAGEPGTLQGRRGRRAVQPGTPQGRRWCRAPYRHPLRQRAYAWGLATAGGPQSGSSTRPAPHQAAEEAS
jgi:hypothetical protein